MYRKTFSIFFISLVAFLEGCAYRFSTLYSRYPEGVKTIAIESIYDTTRYVVPHDMLWQAFQRAFAEQGYFLLDSDRNADGLIRVHLNSFQRTLSGSLETLQDPISENIRDPEVSSDKPAPPISRFKTQTQASRSMSHETVSFGMEVEFWNLKERRLIYKNSYSLASDYPVRRDSSITNISNQFLRTFEAGELRFSEMSKNVAEKFVQDLLLTQ